MITVEQLRMAALLLNTSRELPKFLALLEQFGARRVSEVKEQDRLACLNAIIEIKMARRYAIWRMTT